MTLMKIKRWSSVLILWMLIICLILPRSATAAQSDTQDDDFIVTLALMAVVDDRLDGVMDASALSDLRATLDDYYTQKNYLQMDTATSTRLSYQKSLILNALDNKINNQKTLDYRAKLGLFAAMVDSTDERYRRDPETYGNPFDIMNAALSGSPTPDPQLRALLQQRLASDTQSALADDLNGRVAADVPGGADLLAQDTVQVYDPAAGLPDTSNEPPTIVGLPLVFTNMGGRDVRVIIEYYEPPLGLQAYAPGLNLHVAGDSSVLVDGFPQGNYVFCVDWETDYDTDDDGLKDFDRAVIHGWITSAVADNFLQAREVDVSADYSETPSGLCDGFKGESPTTETWMKEFALELRDIMTGSPTEALTVPTQDINPPVDIEPSQGSLPDDEGNPVDAEQGGGDDDSGGSATSPGLTAAELTNQGNHQYQMTCENEGLSDTRSFSATWTFSASGVTGSNGFYARIGPNTYRNDYPTTITFTSSGYLVVSSYTETSSEGLTTTSQTNCTATIQ